ncbi:hypothetical protein BV25DRAFT_1813774 [Artomyces pyxidatus]|uniref:Uncharacterized protein n=1 Tax=Artomyces pyxidatus TaxID=48021 RepID=A0ACB8SJL1_9AGAM|nr:hypothetical protein BV25DRAFT_1813774 [Artomyces pyxidatus]
MALSALFALSAASYVVAQGGLATFPATPLASKHFAYPSGIPEQAGPEQLARGDQAGYNICNSTTEGPDSKCQTSFVNSIDDFCLWAPISPDSTISNTEGEEVAWCTKKGHGTRLIPAGTLTGVQLLKTPAYIQITGYMDQTKVNMAGDDDGGEMDPHGQDLRGNPIGGLMYSNGFPSNGGNNQTYQQVIEWVNFMGSNSFCLKVCDPAGTNPAGYCQHTLDRIGCAYNAPSNAPDGTFEVCDSDNMDVPGIYTVNGQTFSYSEPPETLGAITTIPYQPRVPASSNCVTYQSTALYTDLLAASAAPSSSSVSSTASGSASSVVVTQSSSGASHAATSTPGASAGPSASVPSSGSGPAPTGSSNGAARMGLSFFGGVVGIAFSILYFA